MLDYRTLIFYMKKITVTVLAIITGLSIAFLIPRDQPVKPEQHAAILEKVLPMYPELQPSYDKALADGEFTKSEAMAILNDAKSIKASNQQN